MKKFLYAGAAIASVAAGLYFYQSATKPDTSSAASSTGAPLVNVTLPTSFSSQAKLGEQAFNAVCAACHGENAVGKEGFGPPLVHKIYEPSHHGDASFHLAVEQGVRAHHWPYGNMPAQEGLTRGDVIGIVAYVRELQRANGIN